jgi:hypothetical protein
VIVQAGDLRDVFPFKWPTERTEATEELGSDREQPLFLGQRSWAGKEGTLVLAPPYGLGGINGDHLIFRWEGESRSFAVSLHAWDPLPETTATLEAIVRSIPKP